MVIVPRRAAVVSLAFMGVLSAVPSAIAGLVLFNNGLAAIGIPLMCCSAVLAAVSAARACRVELAVDADGIRVVNRWRAFRVDLADFKAIEEKNAWWSMFTGSAPVLGIVVRGRAFSHNVTATFAMSQKDPTITAFVEEVRHRQQKAGGTTS